MKWILPALLCLCIAACTTLGTSDEAELSKRDFGSEETLHICVFLDEPKITQRDGEALITAIAQELTQYKIRVVAPWYRSWHRPNGRGMAIIESLATEQLAPPCDRLLAMVGRNFRDFLVGLLVDELGSVDTVTSTRGYVAANIGTLDQLFVPPDKAVVHEAYHLLGCQHDISMTECYNRIQQLKAAAAENRAHSVDFFPSFTRRGKLITNRAEVNVRESMAFRVEHDKASRNQASQFR